MRPQLTLRTPKPPPPVIELDESLNVFDEPLKTCSNTPPTGFFRDGCCNTGPLDHGRHTVCVLLTIEFLAFSKQAGNDLSTPRPEYGFEGLKPGQRWCLCADRWAEAEANNAAPKVVLEATHKNTLQSIPFETLRAYAIDLN